MPATIPEKYRDLFSKKAFAHLATLMPDGSPQVTPVWCDYDGTHIRVNSAKGRVKDKNMRRAKKVALSITDPDNPYRSLAVQGDVSRSRSREPMPTSICWRKNIWEKTSTLIASPARCGCSTKSCRGKFQRLADRRFVVKFFRYGALPTYLLVQRTPSSGEGALAGSLTMPAPMEKLITFFHPAEFMSPQRGMASATIE